MRVVESLREGLGLAQRRQDTPEVARRQERRAQGEPEIDGLLARGALLWQMREGAERLLEVPHGLAVGRPPHGLLPRLPAVRQGLVPHLAPQGMVGQAFDLVWVLPSGRKALRLRIHLGYLVSAERFEALDNPGVEHPSPLQQEAAVGHLVCQGMLEGIFALREQPRLVEKLGGLQARQAALQRVFRQLGDGLQ